MFLELLYCGHIQLNSLSTDQLTELLTLADRYEVISYISQNYNDIVLFTTKIHED